MGLGNSFSMSSTTNAPPTASHKQSTTASAKDPELLRHAKRTQQAMLKVLDKKRLEHQAKQR